MDEEALLKIMMEEQNAEWLRSVCITQSILHLFGRYLLAIKDEHPEV